MDEAGCGNSQLYRWRSNSDDRMSTKEWDERGEEPSSVSQSRLWYAAQVMVWPAVCNVPERIPHSVTSRCAALQCATDPR